MSVEPKRRRAWTFVLNGTCVCAEQQPRPQTGFSKFVPHTKRSVARYGRATWLCKHTSWWGRGGSLRPLRHPADLKTRKHDWCLPKETGHCRRELFRMREHISHSLVSAARQGKSPCEHRKCHFPPIGRGREIGHFLLGTFLSLGPRRLISRVRLHARPLHAMCFSAHARTLVHVRGRCGVVITWNWRQTNGHYQFHAHLFPFVFLCAFVDWRGKLETASFV